MIMESDNTLLPPTIHLGHLPDEHVVALLRRAKESIQFVGPGSIGVHGQHQEEESKPMNCPVAFRFATNQLVRELTEALQGDREIESARLRR
jgi:hypothetical protein